LNLLVVPVFREDSEVTFYIPKTKSKETEKWVSWFEHSKLYEGGQWHTEACDFDMLTILIRPGLVIATNPKLKASGDDALDGL